MNNRRTTLLIALVLALGTGWLTLSYVSSLRSQSQAQVRQVLVSTAEIPARSTITASMFETQNRPSTGLQPDALADPNAAVGQVALVTIPAGSQITTSEIGTQTNSSLPVRLQPGMRAVSIQFDRVRGVSGLIQSGDRVDVIAIPSKIGNYAAPAVTILRGIRVLAIGDALESPSATPPPDEQSATTVTLEVNITQADLLAWADANSTLRLALRSPKEPIPTQAALTLPLLAEAFAESPIAPAPAPAPAAPSAPAPPAPRPDPPLFGGVQVIVGDRIVGRGSQPEDADQP
jgi:pilus assembly protein CpaB